MEKQIFLDKEAKHRLAKDLGVSKVTVWSALKYKYTGGRSDLIRKMALERGGRVVGDSSLFIPQCDTFFKRSSDEMVQIFSDRVKIVVHNSGKVAVLVDDVVKSKYDNMSITEFMNLQREVQNISIELSDTNINQRED